MHKWQSWILGIGVAFQLLGKAPKKRDTVCTAGAHTSSLVRKELFSKATRWQHLFGLDSGPQLSSRPPTSAKPTVRETVLRVLFAQETNMVVQQ